jgi:hypothetical protein
MSSPGRSGTPRQLHRRGLSGPVSVAALVDGGGGALLPTMAASLEYGGRFRERAGGETAPPDVPSSARGRPPPVLGHLHHHQGVYPLPSSLVIPAGLPPPPSVQAASVPVRAASVTHQQHLRRGKSLDNLSGAAGPAGSMALTASVTLDQARTPITSVLVGAPGWDRGGGTSGGKPGGVYLTEMVLTPPPSSGSPTSRAPSPSLTAPAPVPLGVRPPTPTTTGAANTAAATPLRQASLLHTLDDTQAGIVAEGTPLFRGATTLRDFSHPPGPGSLGAERSSLPSPLVGAPTTFPEAAAPSTTTTTTSGPGGTDAMPAPSAPVPDYEEQKVRAATVDVDITLSAADTGLLVQTLHVGRRSVESLRALLPTTDEEEEQQQKEDDRDDEDEDDEEVEDDDDGLAAEGEELVRHGFVDSAFALLESQSLDSLLPMDSGSGSGSLVAAGSGGSSSSRLGVLQTEGGRKRRGSIAVRFAAPNHHPRTRAEAHSPAPTIGYDTGME